MWNPKSNMGSYDVLAMYFISIICMLISLPPIYGCGYCEPHPPYRQPNPPMHPRPIPPQHGGGGGSVGNPPTHKPVLPPIVRPPPATTPPITNPPGSGYPPYTSPPGSGGGGGHGGGGTGGSPGSGGGGQSGGSPGGGGGGSPGSGGGGHSGGGGGGSSGGGGGGSGGPGCGGRCGGGVPGLIPPPATCPINALKLGACVDLLGGLVHIGLGDPVENECCPLLQGLVELEAAICLCTTIRLKLLNLNIFIPLALQVLATCGITPPAGFVCPPLL